VFLPSIQGVRCLASIDRLFICVYFLPAFRNTTSKTNLIVIWSTWRIWWGTEQKLIQTYVTEFKVCISSFAFEYFDFFVYFGWGKTHAIVRKNGNASSAALIALYEHFHSEGRVSRRQTNGGKRTKNIYRRFHDNHKHCKVKLACLKQQVGNGTD